MAKSSYRPIIAEKGAAHSHLIDFLHGKKINIPEYQRFYEWKEDLINQLFEDIMLSIADKKNLFIGVLIYKVRNGACMIVDGQQRIVTFLILLRALHGRGKLIENQKRKILNMMNSFVATDEDVFSLNECERRGFFKRYILQGQQLSSGDKENVIFHNIIKCKELFEKKIGSLNKKECTKVFEYIKDNIEIVYIILNKDADENDIFESINAKKLPLSDADLIKNYFLSKSNHERNLAEAQKIWDRMYSLLENLDNVNDYFETYYTMKYGAEIEDGEDENVESYRSSSNTLYHKYRNQKHIKVSKDHVGILRDMEAAAQIYRKMLNSDAIDWGADSTAKNINRALKYLSHMKFTTSYPLILRVIKECNCSKDQVLQIIESSEAYSFLSIVIRKDLPQKTKNYYGQLLQILIKESNINGVNKILKNLRTEMLHLKNNEKVIESFIGNNYAKKHQWYILSRIYFTGSTSIDTRTIDDIKRFTLEHIMPKQYSEWKEEIIRDIRKDDERLKKNMPNEYKETDNYGQKADIYHDNYIDRIGNVSILANAENSKIKNAPFIVNGPKYRDSAGGKRYYNEKRLFYKEMEAANILFDDVINKEKWSWGEIDERSKKYATKYFNIFV